jgi:hypothetical protein
MPQYMLLIYTPAEGGPSPEELQAAFPAWGAYTQALQDAGVMVAGAPLEPTDTATTVRVRNGDTVVSDGPFAETKEALGGYYLIDVPNLDEALKWAARIPSGTYGSTEVRPVMVVPGMDQAGATQAGAQA